MQAREFLNMERTGESTFRFTVEEKLTTPGRFLFGGCGLAAGVIALEDVSGRQLRWATAQYLSYAPMGCVATVTTEMLVEGGRVTQARAIMHAEGREVLTVSGALGTGDIQQPAPWVRPIAVPPPEECPPRPWRSLGVNSVFDHVETRVAHGRHTLGEYDGTPGEPLTAYWLRHPSHLDPEAATLAIFGDFMAGSFSQPVGRILFGRSLDNTLRIASSEPTEWVLAEMHQHALVDGFGQGTMYLWSEKGTLLATASQSVSTIYYDGPPLGTLQKTE